MGPIFWISLIEQANSPYPQAILDHQEDFLVDSSDIPSFLNEISKLLKQENGCLDIAIKLNTLTEPIILAIADLYQQIKQRIKPGRYSRFTLKLTAEHLVIDPALLSEQLERDCEALRIGSCEDLCRYHYPEQNTQLQELHIRYMKLKEALNQIAWHNQLIILDDQDYRVAHTFTGVVANQRHDLSIY